MRPTTLIPNPSVRDDFTQRRREKEGAEMRVTPIVVKRAYTNVSASFALLQQSHIARRGFEAGALPQTATAEGR